MTVIAPLEHGLKLKEGDYLHLGKARLELLRLVWTTSNRANHYEMLREPTISEKQSIFAGSFYSQKEKASLL